VVEEQLRAHHSRIVGLGEVGLPWYFAGRRARLRVAHDPRPRAPRSPAGSGRALRSRRALHAPHGAAVARWRRSSATTSSARCSTGTMAPADVTRAIVDAGLPDLRHPRGRLSRRDREMSRRCRSSRCWSRATAPGSSRRVSPAWPRGRGWWAAWPRKSPSSSACPSRTRVAQLTENTTRTFELNLGVTVVVEKHRVALPGGALAMALHLPIRPRAWPPWSPATAQRLQGQRQVPVAGEALPAAGFALARFDFPGCGSRAASRKTPRSSAAWRTWRPWSRSWPSTRAWNGRVGLLGSSLGGFVALQVAARRSGLPPLPVVTWNAPASLTELANDDLRENRGLGVPFALEYATGRYGAGAHRPAAAPDRSRRRRRGRQPRARRRTARARGRAVRLRDHPGGDHRLTDPAHREPRGRPQCRMVPAPSGE